MDSCRYGGVDLRDKVVAARAFWAGLDPYQDEWAPPASERLLDPYRRYPGPSRATITPVALLGYGSLSWLPFKIQRWLWFLLQWAAMVASVIILLRTIPSQQARFVFLCCALLFFISGFFWRLHLERGQIYIFLTLFLSLGIYLEMFPNVTKYSGIPWGIMVSLRPTYVLLLPIYFIFKKYKSVKMMTITATILFLTTILLGGIKPWISWSNNVKNIELSLADPDFLVHNYGPAYSVSPQAEGIDFHNLLAAETYNETFVGLTSLLYHKLGKRFPLILLAVSKLLAALFIMFTIIIAYINRNRNIDNISNLLITLVMVTSIDYFLPIRFSYADVLFLPILALIVPFLTSNYTYRYFLIVLLLAFGIGHPLVPIHGYLGALMALIRSMLFMMVLNLIVILMTFGKIQLNPGFCLPPSNRIIS